jgi:dihydrofolate reductase
MANKQTVIGIVAFDDHMCMGLNGKLPWSLPEDLQWFKEQTMGCPLIMGRNTWGSLPKQPLPGRANIIVSGSTVETITRMGYVTKGQIAYRHPEHKDVHTCANPGSALSFAQSRYSASKTFVIGGAQLFENMLKNRLIDELWITRVYGFHRGDIFFPAIPVVRNNEWRIYKREHYDKYDRLWVKL